MTWELRKQNLTNEITEAPIKKRTIEHYIRQRRKAQICQKYPIILTNQNQTISDPQQVALKQVLYFTRRAESRTLSKTGSYPKDKNIQSTLQDLL